MGQILFLTYIDQEEKPYDKNPSIKSTRQMRTQVDTTKEKTKIRSRPYAKKTHENKMTIKDNKEDLRQKKLCHLLQIG